jgi:oxysterol-binding protein-related protein 8
MADPSVEETSQEALDDEPKNVLFAMIKQLKYGMDLHRITFPTFVLEPRSMLERITDFMSHQDLLFAYGPARPLRLSPVALTAGGGGRGDSVAAQPTPLQRFVGVVQYFLSGWHIRPKVRAGVGCTAAVSAMLWRGGGADRAWVWVSGVRVHARA